MVVVRGPGRIWGRRGSMTHFRKSKNVIVDTIVVATIAVVLVSAGPVQWSVAGSISEGSLTATEDPIPKAVNLHLFFCAFWAKDKNKPNIRYYEYHVVDVFLPDTESMRKTD